jgi:hypothetical protein
VRGYAKVISREFPMRAQEKELGYSFFSLLALNSLRPVLCQTSMGAKVKVGMWKDTRERDALYILEQGQMSVPQPPLWTLEFHLFICQV